MAEALGCDLIERYRESLLRHLRQCGFDRETAEDAVQTVALQWARSALVLDDGHPTGYMCCAARRQAAGLRERNPVFKSLDERAEQDGGEGEALLDRLADHAPGPDVLAVEGDLLRVVVAAAAELADRDQFVLARLIGGDNVLQIGRELVVDRQHAITLAGRARRRLAERLPADLVPA